MQRRRQGQKQKSDGTKIYIDDRCVSFEQFLQELVEAENDRGWFPTIPNPHCRRDKDPDELARKIKDRFLNAVWSALWAAFCEEHREYDSTWDSLDRAIPKVIPASGVIRLVDHGGRCNLEGLTGFLAGLLVARLLPQFSEAREGRKRVSLSA